MASFVPPGSVTQASAVAMSSVPLLRSSPCRSSLWAIKAFSGSSVWHSLHSKTCKAPCNLLETLRLLFAASIFAASLCACCSPETDERSNQRASHIHIYIYCLHSQVLNEYDAYTLRDHHQDLRFHAVADEMLRAIKDSRTLPTRQLRAMVSLFDQIDARLEAHQED